MANFYPKNSLTDWDRRVRAARQLCDLLGVEFIGIRTPIAWARAIKRGDVHVLPARAHKRIASVRKQSLDGLVESLLT